LRGNSGIKAFRRFSDSPTGRQIIRERRILLDTLSDRARLTGLPEESVGRSYFTFMESENLSPTGLVEASEAWEIEPLPPEVALFRSRMRDAHDLTHILTGYGRDRLGELCLLAFMHDHSRQLGQLLVLALAWKHLKKAGHRAVIQAWRHGRRACWLLDQDYEALLPRPLADVRHELNIQEPSLYRAAIAGTF
jgi:ubiquinone biosynthesis protein COQ4